MCFDATVDVLGARATLLSFLCAVCGDAFFFFSRGPCRPNRVRTGGGEGGGRETKKCRYDLRRLISSTGSWLHVGALPPSSLLPGGWSFLLPYCDPPQITRRRLQAHHQPLLTHHGGTVPRKYSRWARQQLHTWVEAHRSASFCGALLW